MFDITDYKQVFPKSDHIYWGDQGPQGRGLNEATVRWQIAEQVRKGLDGLFIDKILNLVGFRNPSKYFPVKSEKGLQTLHQLVVQSDSNHMIKLSILCYLHSSLIVPEDQNDERTQRTQLDQFVTDCSMPDHYVTFMKGLYLMDTGEFEEAFEELVDASILPTFQEEILTALLTTANRPSLRTVPGAQNISGGHAGQMHDYHLATLYFEAVQPEITLARTADYLFMAYMEICEVPDAYSYIRNQSEFAQKKMLGSLISNVIQGPRSGETAERALHLVNLPLDANEEEWFTEFLTTGDGRQYKSAKDTLIMRKIAKGQCSEAIKVQFSASTTVDDLNWKKIQQGLSESIGCALV